MGETPIKLGPGNWEVSYDLQFDNARTRVPDVDIRLAGANEPYSLKVTRDEAGTLATGSL
jgi:hypothetical protein